MDSGTFSSAGIGSGLDIEGIIGKLVELERQPIEKLETKKAGIEVQVSALGSLKSTLSEFQEAVSALADGKLFSAFDASSSDDEVFTATADTSATPSNHEINVIALAQRHRLSSDVFTGPDDVVGTGTLTLAAGSKSYSIEIDDTNNTLSGIRDEINNVAQNEGVSATIINVDGGSRLVLTASETGLDNTLEISVADDADGNNADGNGLSRFTYLADGVQNLTEVDVALDAELEVDGFAVTSASNTVSGVIEGVSIDAVKIGNATLNVGRNTSEVNTTISGLVEAYNKFNGALDAFRTSDLQGDNILLNVETAVRGVFGAQFQGEPGSLSYLFEAGLSFDKDGNLSLNEEKLSKAISEDLGGVTALFSDSDNGFASRLEQALDGIIQTGGAIDSRTNGLQDRDHLLDSQIERAEFRMTMVEARLRKQYGALDTVVAQLQSTSTYLTQQLANLPGNNLNKN